MPVTVFNTNNAIAMYTKYFFKPISFITLLIFFSNSRGQSIEPILDADTVQWNYYTDYDAADLYGTASYYAYGDSSIGGKTYRKIYENYAIHGYYLYGMLKEDTVQGKLWIRMSGDTTDYLIMDMGLQVDDTFLMKNISYEPWSELYVVKDTAIEQQKKVILLEGQKGFNQIKFIEGVGTSFIFQLLYEPWIYNKFLCAYKNNTLVYQDPGADSCHYPTIVTGMEERDQDKVNIYPVPAEDVLNIVMQGKSRMINEVSLYDVSGKKILSQYFDTDKTTIDLSAIDRAGVYFIKITTSGSVIMKRFIKN